MACKAQHPFPISEKICRFTLGNRKNIIIEIEIFLIQSFYTVKVHLYGIAIECRQKRLWNNILMEDYPDILSINPFRHLSRVRNNKKDISYKRHVALHTPQKIFQGSPVPESLIHDRGIGIMLIILLPFRIISINVCNDNIHIT